LNFGDIFFNRKQNRFRVFLYIFEQFFKLSLVFQHIDSRKVERVGAFVIEFAQITAARRDNRPYHRPRRIVEPAPLLGGNVERFLRVWHELMMRLPKGDVGVVDRSLACYHQLDESCLNAALTFLPDAPRVTATYTLDKDPPRLFAHFIGRPKPWEGWTPRSARHIEAVVSTVEWAVAEGLELPGDVPFSLRRDRLSFNRATARWSELWFKVRKRICGGKRNG